jgi:hypothetical protein
MLWALEAIKRLKPSGYYIHQEVLCLNILHSAHILHVRVSYASQNKQSFFFSAYSVKWLVYVTYNDSLLRGKSSIFKFNSYYSKSLKG